MCGGLFGETLKRKGKGKCGPCYDAVRQSTPEFREYQREYYWAHREYMLTQQKKYRMIRKKKVAIE